MMFPWSVGRTLAYKVRWSLCRAVGGWEQMWAAVSVRWVWASREDGSNSGVDKSQCGLAWQCDRALHGRALASRKKTTNQGAKIRPQVAISVNCNLGKHPGMDPSHGGRRDGSSPCVAIPPCCCRSLCCSVPFPEQPKAMPGWPGLDGWPPRANRVALQGQAGAKCLCLSLALKTLWSACSCHELA